MSRRGIESALAGLLALAGCHGRAALAPSDARPADADDAADGCGTAEAAERTSLGVLVDDGARTRAVGVGCAFGSQCGSGVCGAGAAGACGVCLERRALGARCDGPQQGCSASAVCRDGTCQSTKEVVGEPCHLQPKGEDLLDCDDDLFCARTSTELGTCTVRLALGAACDYAHACAFGTLCVAGACAIPAPDECRDRSCPPGSFCGPDQTCRPATMPLGARCGIVDGVAVDDGCGAGAICGSLDWPNGGGGPATVTTCLALPAAGETCILDQCALDAFCAQRDDPCTGAFDRRCERLRRDGETCQSSVSGVEHTTRYANCAAPLECREGHCASPCR